MRGLVLALGVIAVLAVPLAAQARKDDSAGNSFGEKLFEGYWGDKIWEGYHFEPYLGDQPIKNRILWDRDQWTPQDWIKDVGGDPRGVVRDLYDTGILTNQYKDGDNIPVLEVGEKFLRLSNTDRIRVLRFVDYVYGVTKEKDGMFFVYSQTYEDKPLGTYDKRGFQQY